MISRRRPRHHTYDYNFKVGESSYQDMLAYLDRKEGRRAASPPPGRKSFAERFVERPIYGEVGRLARDDVGVGPASGAGRPLLEDDLIPLKPRPSAALAVEDGPMDLEVEEFLAGLRRRPRQAQPQGPARVPGEEGEDLGTRTRRALQQIDAEFEQMGIYGPPAAPARALESAAEDEAIALKAASVSATHVTAKVSSKKAVAAESSSKKAISSESSSMKAIESSGKKKRGVRYIE